MLDHQRAQGHRGNPLFTTKSICWLRADIPHLAFPLKSEGYPVKLV
jgi:hypothetical protein